MFTVTTYKGTRKVRTQHAATLSEAVTLTLAESRRGSRATITNEDASTQGEATQGHITWSNTKPNTNKENTMTKNTNTTKRRSTKTTHFLKISDAAMGALEAEAQSSKVLRSMLDSARSRHGGKAWLVSFTTNDEARALRKALEAVAEYDVPNATVAHAARKAKQIAS